MQPGLTFGLFSLSFKLQDHAFIMRLRYDMYDEVYTVLYSETCFRNAYFSKRHTMPIWNMFQDGTCFRTARNTYVLQLLCLRRHTLSRMTHMSNLIQRLQHNARLHFSQLFSNRGIAWGARAPSEAQSPLPLNPQMKWHFLQGSMECCLFQS